MFPWHDGTKWKCAVSGVGHFDCTDGSVLVADTQASGGGGSGGSISPGWVDVPLTGAADFDINCEYRFLITPVGTGYNYYVNAVSAKTLLWWTNGDGSQKHTISSTAKSSQLFNGSPVATIGKIEKLCQ